MADSQGGVTVPLARGIFSGRRHEGRTRKPILELLAKHNTAVYQISRFKYEPTFYPELVDIRRLSVACSLCLPDASMQLDEEVRSYGIHNCFNLETENRSRSFFIRLFPLLSYFWEKGRISAGQSRYVNPKEVMEDPDVLKSVLPQSPESQEEIDRLYKTLEQVSKDMCSTQCWAAVLLVRLSGWLLGKVLSAMFDTVCVHNGEIELLQRAGETDLPIIYIPVNRSFMDSLIIHWTLIHTGLRTPNFFTSSRFRYLTKYFGGVGPAQHRVDEQQKLIYGSALNSYVRLLLKNSSSIQISLEAHRSRSGKPSTELYGTELLQMVYDSFVRRDIEDVYIVPVSVSYEILPDSFDIKGSEDETREKTSILSVIKSIWRAMSKRLGGVRVDFGQPFSFRELHPVMKKSKKINTVMESVTVESQLVFESYAKTYEASELCWNSEHGSTASIPSLYGDLYFHEEDSEFVPILLDTLANHVIYSGMNFSTPMCTHLVSFVLLKRFRYGTTMDTLVKEVTELKKLLEKRGRDVGFSGDITSAVTRAIELLGPRTITIYRQKLTNSETEEVFVKAVLDFSSLQRLDYYANMILPTLAMEAVVAVAVFALIGNQLAVARGFDRDVRVKDEEIMSHTRRVYEVFSGEFFLHSPCLTTEVAIRKTLDIMNDASLLQFLMDETLKRTRRGYESDVEEDFEEEGTKPASSVAGGEFFFIPYEYKVVSSEENYQKLSFLRSLLVPYLEVYGVVSSELECLLSQDGKVIHMEEPILRKKILQKLEDSFSESEYGEILSEDTVKTAIFTFEEHVIIHCNVNKDTKVRRICLSAEYDSLAKLQEVSNNILRYVTR